MRSLFAFVAGFAILAMTSGAFGQRPMPPTDQVDPPTVVINEICVDGPGPFPMEFFELMGPPGQSLKGYWYIVIGDSEEWGTYGGYSGVIEEAICLKGYYIPKTGCFMACEPLVAGPRPDMTTPLNFEDDDNVTHMIVTRFYGAIGQDLDLDDDGVLDVRPWTEVIDSVSLIKTPKPDGIIEEHYYGDFLVGPDGDFAPVHVFRCADPFDQFFMGSFKGSDGTPGEENFCP